MNINYILFLYTVFHLLYSTSKGFLTSKKVLRRLLKGGSAAFETGTSAFHPTTLQTNEQLLLFALVEARFWWSSWHFACLLRREWIKNESSYLKLLLSLEYLKANRSAMLLSRKVIRSFGRLLIALVEPAAAECQREKHPSKASSFKH